MRSASSIASILLARAPQEDRTVAHSPLARPLHSTVLFVTHDRLTLSHVHNVADANSVVQLLVEEPVLELLRLPPRPSLSRNRRNTSSSVAIGGLRPKRSP